MGALTLIIAPVRGDTGDVESSHDYPPFTRPPGFLISDYDEDNPADFNFPVAQPLADDADHVVTVPVKGHRYVIRYELSAGARGLSLFQTQQYYEKQASDNGFTVEKSGAVGDVTETFFKATTSHTIWVYLAPAVTTNVLTVVEAASDALPPGPPPPPRLVVNTATLPPPPVPPKPIPTTPNLSPPPETPSTPTPAPAPTPEPGPTPVASSPAPDVSPQPSTEDANGESLFSDLNDKGRIVLPFAFQPGKEALDPSSQPLVDRVVAMMKAHPDLFLRIEGHTDNTGYPEDNLRLSAGRALAVQAKIVAGDIDRKRLDAVGVGGLQPIASNVTAEGREKNRRIELVLWKKYPAFHAPAPNGNNYYPGGTPAPSRAGL
jgi:outer membrane protein OmpA-like peptidoglycan-associated protein